MCNKLISIVKKDVVLTVAAVLALVSCFVVPPDGKYLSYIDWNTLILLFCLMLIVGGLRAEGVFESIGHKLLGRVRTARGVVLTLVGLCFFSSMFITNDVALITFVPFGIFLLETAGVEDYADLTLNGQARNVALTDEQIATVGTVTLEVMQG